ncbi:LysR substrate-binding domain-containing protein, partial [Chloroflexota bacterium]
FLIAADTLNFTQAAQRLHMSQPSVSQHVQTLERHFDTKLFIRSNRNLQLTDAGMALVPLALDMVKQSTLIEETMASLDGAVYGHLMVGCSTTPGKYVLPQLLARFHSQYPRVKVTCQVAPQTLAIQSLCDGQVHFALTSFAQQSTRDAEFRKFMRDPVVLIAPKDHPWAEHGEIDPQDLYDVDFIMREPESGTYSTVSGALNQIDVSIDHLNTMMTLGNSEAIALSVKEGLGVGFVSQIVVTKLGADDVALIKVRGLEIFRIIHIGRHIRRSATAAQDAFWKFISGIEYPFGNIYAL